MSTSTYPNGGLAMASSFVHLTETEVELLKRWQVVRPGTLRPMVCNM